MSNQNFFHELSRAPEVHITVEAIAEAAAIDFDTATTPYEAFLKSIGQLRQYKFRMAGR